MTPLAFFDLYSHMGFKVIPLYPKTKIPIGKGWNQNWNQSKSREVVAKRRDCNLGALLGDIVDVEGDTPEANEFLDLLIGKVPHPVYRSRKSHHHLFRTPDPNLTRVAFQGIEFRGHFHQSVLPPSIGPDGTQYLWSGKCGKGSGAWPIPEMPLDLQDFYFKFRPEGAPPIKRRSKKKGLKKGHKQTQCCCCKAKEYIHRKRLMLEVRAFREYGIPGWLCHSCRELDLRDTVRRLRKEYIQSGEAYEMGLKKPRYKWFRPTIPQAW